MNKLIRLLVVFFVVISSQVFAQNKEYKEYTVGEPGPAGGVIIGKGTLVSKTGYIEASLFDIKGPEEGYTWQGAIDACQASPEGGYSDWILPTKEISNLMYLVLTPSHKFSNNFYWTSTEDHAGVAYSRKFSDDVSSYSLENSGQDVRCVRGFAGPAI